MNTILQNCLLAWQIEDPITPTISIALYRYLCTNIVGTENHVKRIRLINAIRDNVASSKKCTVITSGSFGEGLELRGSDIDIMYVIKRLEVCEDGEPRFYQNISVLSMEGDDVKPGYTQLRLIQSENPTDFKCCELHNDRLYYSSTLYKKQFLCNKTTIHGPCVTDQSGLLDSAMCFHCKLWISPAVPWITRSSYSWPSDDVKESIIKHGVLFVPIGVKGSPREDIEWRISFSVGEKFLINTFTHTQLLCYSLLKIILKDVIATYSECKELLCSYFLKTIVFWLSEELPQFVWTPDNIIPCFMRCFNRLIYCVEHSVCSHFFIPENNMFENKIEGDAREILLEKLNTLHSYGWRCILFSDQISFNFNVSMWNIPIEPCILYVKELGKKLNSNLLECEDLAVQWADWNTFDNIILQIISCQQSSIKQTSTLFLSKWCNRHAQIIPLDSTINSNKYQYMQHKACISTLLQNVYHDAVSGWLMIASFFYKRKQYNKALHVIRYSLSKCTLEKLYKDVTISDVHCHLLKLQLFQKKSFCFLLKIMFVDKLQLVSNSTLLPDELQMDGSNELYFIPSAAYGHFLNFLCHYHLHNVRQCQNSLWGLQLVIEQNYLVRHKLYEGVAFNIYGIALQLAGDKELARQAFLKSVKLYPDDPNSALERLLLMD